MKGAGRTEQPGAETLDGNLRWQIVRIGLHVVYREHREELGRLRRLARGDEGVQTEGARGPLGSLPLVALIAIDSGPAPLSGTCR